MEIVQTDIAEDTQRMNCSKKSCVISNISTNKNWLQEIVAGNNAMEKKFYSSAYEHYEISLDIAKNIFKAHQGCDNVPNIVVPSIVVSYLNICELWNKQNKTAAKKDCLCAAFDYLVAQLQIPNICSVLKEQLWCGLDKVYIEIITMGDLEIVAMKKKSLMELR